MKTKTSSVLMVVFLSVLSQQSVGNAMDNEISFIYNLLFSPRAERTEASCSDLRDNDKDGHIDCFDSDCATTEVCQNSCTNGILDYGEYWADCGGSCDPCPTCGDGIQNGDEAGVDCGGSCISCSATGDGQMVDIEDSATYGYNFRMYLPPGYSNDGKYPRLIFLHGAGERGYNLNKVAVHDPLKFE